MNKQQAAYIAVAEKVAAEYRADKHNVHILSIISTMYEEAKNAKLGGPVLAKIKEIMKSCSPGLYEGYFKKPKTNRVNSAIAHDNN